MQVRSAITVGSVVATAMMVAIAYGMASGGFVEEFSALLETPWARVTLLDLVAGFSWSARGSDGVRPLWLAQSHGGLRFFSPATLPSASSW